MFGQTDWRFKSTLVQRRRDKIKREEEIAGRLAGLESANNAVQKAELEGAIQAGSVQARTLTHQEHLQQRETRLAHTALILVRREALHRVLELERQLYNNEKEDERHEELEDPEYKAAPEPFIS
ncbi:hypothetical protein AOLI_G00051210 [Acnodon oligacanthus]